MTEGLIGRRKRIWKLSAGIGQKGRGEKNQEALTSTTTNGGWGFLMSKNSSK